MTLAIAATLDFPGAQPQYKMVDVTVDAAANREPSGDLVWTQSYDVSGLGEHLTLVLGDYAWNLAQFDLDLSASGT